VVEHAVLDGNGFQVLNKQLNLVTLDFNELKIKFFHILVAKELHSLCRKLILEEQVHLRDVFGTIVDGFYIFLGQL